MAHPTNRKRRSFRGFLILAAIVLIGGLLLWQTGNLANPFDSLVMVANLSSGDEGFAMVGERPMPPANSSVTDTTSATSADAGAAGTVSTSAETTSDVSAVSDTASGTMTMETFTAELAAAGVDMNALATTLSAEGRTLDTLREAVNSGRTTVDALATRLSSESSTAAEAAQPPNEESSGLLDIRWDEFGGVLYDLWVILAATLIVIVIGRPVGWLVNRIKDAGRLLAPAPSSR